MSHALPAAAPPIRIDSSGRVPRPRDRILAFLATVAEARPCVVRRGARLTLPLYRVESILRELAREGLVGRRDAHLPPPRAGGDRRHVVFYRLARPAGVEP